MSALVVKPGQILYSTLSGYWKVLPASRKQGCVELQKLTDELVPCNLILTPSLSSLTEDVWRIHAEPVAVPLSAKLATPARYAVHAVLTVLMFSVMSLCWLERNGWGGLGKV